MISRSLKIFWTAFPFILSFTLDLRRFILFGPRRERTLEFHESRARKLTQKIAVLGPSFIKLTQVLSTRSDILPPVYLAALSKLHDEVPPISLDAVKKVIKAEYQRPFDEVFEQFDPRSLAAASLAQVHRARYQGMEVAVKVQRPGIHALVTDDLKIIQGLLGILNRLFNSYQLRSLQVVVDEFSRTIYDEMDFEHESHNIRRFQELMKDRSDIVIPEFFPEVTTPRILVIRFYHGIKITEFEQLKRAGINVDRVLRSLIEIYAKQILMDGVVHADPHPGNILVTRDEKIVLVDYGLVVELDHKTRKELIETTMAGARRDFDRLIEGYYNLGIANREVSTTILREAAEIMFDILSQEGITQRRVQEIAFEVLESFYAFPFELPSNLVYVFKTAALVEGIGTQYRYDFNAVKDIVPLVKQMLREEQDLNPCKRVEDELKTLRGIYRDAVEVLRTLRREDLRFRIHPVSISQTERYVARVFRRAVIAMAAVMIAVVVSILYVYNQSLPVLIGGLSASGLILLGVIVIPITTTYGFNLWVDLGRRKKKGKDPLSGPPL
jgi:predicted unusual protein kinase regulating ubiquinone biosynthesis (AarF/ABC1/UbiB family)